MLLPRKSPLSTSPRGKPRPHSKQILRPVLQPGEVQKPEESRVLTESHTEPSSQQKLDPQAEPTVTFLLTLLNTPEPKDSESDAETQENQFLDQEDWGPQRTSREMRHLQDECQRLLEAFSTTQVDNLALEENLQNLPTFLYRSLKEGVQARQEEALAQEEVALLQVLREEGLLPGPPQHPEPLSVATRLPEGSAAHPTT